MSDTLKPCPLCGSTNIVCFAEECGDNYDNVPTFRAVVGCCGCHEEGCDPTCDEEPCFGIEAYFSQSHPLIRDVEDPEDCERVLERHMAERWNRRAESTCRKVPGRMKYGRRMPECSECGQSLGDKRWKYCPNCGAKVVGE